jgi:hypothetical protein
MFRPQLEMLRRKHSLWQLDAILCRVSQQVIVCLLAAE